MLKVVFGFLLFTSVSFAEGGATTAGDGGQGVICKAKNFSSRNQIGYSHTVELLDLFEARRQFSDESWSFSNSVVGRQDFYFRNFKNSVCKILSSKQRRLKRLGYQADTLKAFEEACDLADRMRFKSKIPITADFGQVAVPLPSNCQIFQLGYRVKVNGHDEVWINETLAQYLNESELAAILLHEALHPYLNESNLNSGVRKFVALAFAPHKLQVKLLADSQR